MRVLLFCLVNNVLQMTERSSRSQVRPSIESWMCPIASAAILSSTEVMIQTQRQGIAPASYHWIRTFQNKVITRLGFPDRGRFQQCYNYRWLFPVQKVTSLNWLKWLEKPSNVRQTLMKNQGTFINHPVEYGRSRAKRLKECVWKVREVLSIRKHNCLPQNCWPRDCLRVSFFPAQRQWWSVH